MSRFVDALQDGERPLIAEVKRSKPDGSPLVGRRSVGDVVDTYHRIGPGCISVVTGSWFGGDDELLSTTRALTELPILRKDFVTRRDQVTRSRDLGADAVLLTAGLLPPSGLNALVMQCVDLGLAPFVEVTSAAEVVSLDDPGSCVVAVNNRDIRVRETDGEGPERSMRLADAVFAARPAIAVSASGIVSVQAAEALLRRGYEALLVGSALLTSADPVEWGRLRRPAGVTL
ncbi:hypothetical protein [Flexivirga meconopsidis]|uniref:hypothetical protein n=1 Tax=Flexivirga meconopsidis TaxID=2977121 RepID=UPI002240D1BB|nr:hypothetical protein [Flexivirga meconopsidis]